MPIFWSTAAWSPGTLNTSFGQIIKWVKGAWEELLGYHHSSAGRVLAWHAWSWVLLSRSEEQIGHGDTPLKSQHLRGIQGHPQLHSDPVPERVAQEHWIELCRFFIGQEEGWDEEQLTIWAVSPPAALKERVRDYFNQIMAILQQHAALLRCG